MAGYCRFICLVVAAFAAVLTGQVLAQNSSANGIVVDGKSFALNGDHSSYRFHVDELTGDLYSDHFGGPATESMAMLPPATNGWVGMMGRVKREYPDLGRGDFRIPALQIRQSEGYTVSDLQYRSHRVAQGKPGLPGLPATFGNEDEVSTLIVSLYDNYSSIAVDLSYSIFPKYDAIVRSVNITNEGQGNITIDKAAALSIDLPFADMEMIELRGDWAREAMRLRRKVDYGTQGFGSTTGYSSHLHNPFLALVFPETTESQGEAWGFSLVYTGSFSVEVEKGSQGFTRAMLGFNPYQLSWPLGPGETLTTPEVVAVYSQTGVGGLSRKYHRLYRNHLMRGQYVDQTRPALLNSWEGLYFDYNASTIYELAQEAAQLGVKLFVLDDGWFGKEYPRINDTAGLGDWAFNPDRFPDGMPALVNKVVDLQVANSSDKLSFGLWFEPEMVNPNSTLYRTHPDWVLHAGNYPRTERRSQLVLNVALPEVQEFIIESVSNILSSAPISYVKWDNNRGFHETPTPGIGHSYMLGIYHVFEVLTSRFPNVLWEGCASGGGRFDPGILHYFPQIWTSDNTDALDRIFIQFGTSLAYPPAAMGAHVSAVPNHLTGRTIPIKFRAHVAMMGGSFGLELNPADISKEDKAQIPGLMALSELVNPIVIRGDLWRLSLPEDSNWPAAMVISEDSSQAVLFYFQIRSFYNHALPRLRLQGLDPEESYSLDGNGTYSGATLMSTGVQYDFEGDYDSRVVMIQRV
ncbi:melibiase [Colletotrichum graminicola]|uniref:Alpha-galactosidase n=1 Tax=Colletotrichum graminicola (strain M1.001 / M2 / FGSC 10212) TaxID=645133 RepID=E3QYN9_COLGM|nr:melibiase [Colletotrichum graminicola M1.001]EFQ35977.1 melibiase [Colletotrichum graminicola M1.001]WDK16404.1 melibiase [Colletotrichum graminicola]